MTSDKPDVCSKRPARCLREMAFEIPVYATVGDGHLTVPLTMWKEGRASFFEEEERELDVSVRESREYVDLIELTIPDGYRVATLPEAEEVRGLGFAYRFTAEPTATGVRVERALTMKAGGYPAKKYAEIRAPVRAFVAARAKTIVLEKAPATPVPASPEPAPPSK